MATGMQISAMDAIGIYEAVSFLEIEIQNRAHEPISGVYWIHDGSYPDGDFCCNCIDAAVIEHGGERDGGWWYEWDNPCFCETCGEILGYTLTDYGVENELCHFEEWGFDIDDPTECYEMTHIIDGITRDDDARRLRIHNVLAKADIKSRVVKAMCGDSV